MHPSPLGGPRGQSWKEKEEAAWLPWSCHLEMLLPSGHSTGVGESEGATCGFRTPLSQRHAVFSEPSHLPYLDPRPGPCLVSLRLSQHRWSPAWSKPGLLHHLGTCVHSSGISSWDLPGSLYPCLPDLHAGTCTFRINVFIHTHAYIHTNSKIIWLQLSAKIFGASPNDSSP